MIPALIAAGVAAASMANAASKNNEAAKSANKAIDDAKRDLGKLNGIAGQRQTAAKNNAQDALDVYTDLYGDIGTAKGNLDSALAELYDVDPYQASEFSYDKDISDFYDPAFQLSVNMANDGIQNSRALGGGLFSSATADALSAQNNVLATNMYNDARSAMQADRSAEQATWQGNQAAQQAAAASAQNLASTKLGAAQTAAGNLATGYGNYYDAIGSADSDYYGDLADYYQALAGLDSQRQGKSSGLLSGIMTGLF